MIKINGKYTEKEKNQKPFPQHPTELPRTHFVRTLEARVHYFTNDVHKVLCLLNHVVHLDEGGRLAHSRLLHREL